MASNLPLPTDSVINRPGPHMWGPVNVLQLARNPLKYVERLRSRYGDFAYVSLAGLKTWFVSSPSAVEYILYEVRPPKGVGQTQLSKILGHSLPMMEGESWFNQRRLLQPHFTPRQVAHYGEIMVDYTQRTIDTWRNGEVRDVHQDMTHLTLEIVTKSLFDADPHKNEEYAVDRILDEITTYFASNVGQALFADFLPTPGAIRFRNAVKEIDSIIYRIIDEREAEAKKYGLEGRRDLLSMLLSIRDEHNEGMSKKQARDEAMTLFLAGHETTALTLTWCWYMLAQHPQVEAALHKEVDSVLAKGVVSVSDIDKLPYTAMVIKEVMRVIPPVWFIPREMPEDVLVEGHLIRKGEQVIIPQWVIHHRADLYQEPQKFEPERWATDLEKQLPRCAYMPFGAGPRVCMGQHFALMEAILLLATISQRYRFELVANQRYQMKASATLRPKYGIKARLVAR